MPGVRNQDFKIAIFVDAIANRSVFFWAHHRTLHRRAHSTRTGPLVKLQTTIREIPAGLSSDLRAFGLATDFSILKWGKSDI